MVTQGMIHVLKQLLIMAFALIAFAATPFATAASKTSEYVLGPGDVIHITVFQNPDLTTDTRVSESGTITFPLIGNVKVGGLGLQAAEQRVAKHLRDGGFVVQPQVNMLVTVIGGSQVAVIGEVNHPGRFPLQNYNSKVSDMLALAGGMTPTGADTIVLVGTRDGKPYRKEIDVPALFLGNKMSDDVRVAAGDIVYVNRAPQFYIYGEVQKPGGYRIERNMTVMQALAAGGGLTPRGTERGLRINRRGDDGKVQEIKPRLNDEVKGGDVINVRESLF